MSAHRPWIRHAAVGLGFALTAARAAPGEAQQPAPAPTGQTSPPVAGSQLPMYRSPVLALVQPAVGVSVPEDRPIVVFRFAPGEADDPIDARSFAVSVDGDDRTPLFQATATEAWGTLAALGHSTIPAGAHQIVARICSSRGACAEASAVVTVVAPGVASDAIRKDDRRTKGRLIQAVLSALKELLNP